MHDLQSPGVRTLISQAISASVSLFIEASINLCKFDLREVEYSFAAEMSIFLYRR
jgi:hypothetical protein